MNRRLFLQLVSTPAIAGFAVTTYDTPGQRNPITSWRDGDFLHHVARTLHEKLSPMTWNEQMLSMQPIRDVIENHMREHGLVDATLVNTDSVRDFKGRYQILTAMDIGTFYPKIGVQMYPTRKGYDNGVMVKVEYR